MKDFETIVREEVIADLMNRHDFTEPDAIRFVDKGLRLNHIAGSMWNTQEDIVDNILQNIKNGKGN